MRRAQLTAIALWCWTWLAAGCGSPLVSLECKKGYTRCGDECFDLEREAQNCGACGVTCASDEMCVEAACTTAPIDLDAMVPDASLDAALDASRDSEVDDDAGEGGEASTPDAGGGDPDAGADAGVDASLDGSMDAAADASVDAEAGSALDAEAGVEDAFTAPDVVLPPLCTGPGSPVDCVCGIGELKCDLTCVNANTDVDNCGQCNRRCTGAQEPDVDYCINGQCVLNCAAPRTACFNSICADLRIDPNNCNTCGNVCASGLCRNSTCLDAIAGHVIVIGHDMRESVAAMNRLASNAIFLPARPTVRGLVYREHTPPTITDNLQAVIATHSANFGRTFQIAAGDENPTVEAVPLALDRVDVFVIAAQTNATRAQLLAMGRAWAQAMTDFVTRGGVIVLFDGGGTNQGTYQALLESGLFYATGITPLPNHTVTIETQTDAVALEVPRNYESRGGSVTFTTPDKVVVVRDPDSTDPVVVHISR